jgi:hypothetical protein
MRGQLIKSLTQMSMADHPKYTLSTLSHSLIGCIVTY